jgi:RNA polymerase sigma-70 factor, ECF subfamily
LALAVGLVDEGVGRGAGVDIGDDEISRIAAREEGFVLALATRLAPAPGLAEDIAQQVFLEFVEKAEQWDLSRDVRPLLTTMTRHVAKRAWRELSKQQKPKLRELADHIRRLAEDRELSWYTAEDREALKECVKSLPDKSSSLIHAYYSLELSGREIAERLEMTSSAVRQALSRMRRKLRSCMEERLGGTGLAEGGKG